MYDTFENILEYTEERNFLHYPVVCRKDIDSRDDRCYYLEDL